MNTEMSDRVISVANKWIGTPFHGQGRQRQVGCDCIGLILGIGHEVGAASLTGKSLIYCNSTEYDSMQDSRMLLDEMPRHFITITDSPQPGSILLIKLGIHTYHLCIYNHQYIIHACSIAQKVISQTLPTQWIVVQGYKYHIPFLL